MPQKLLIELKWSYLFSLFVIPQAIHPPNQNKSLNNVRAENWSKHGKF